MIVYYVSLALAGIASLIGFFILKKQNQALSNKKALLFYLGFGILLSLGGFISHAPEASHSMSFFLLLQLGYLGMGVLASYLYSRFSPPAPEETALDWGGVCFVLVNAVLGMMGFAAIYHYFSPDALAWYFPLCVVPFVLPRFIQTAFKSYQSIPQEIYNIWYYPLGSEEVDFDRVDTSTIYMLELEYSKSVNDPRLTNTKLRAPVAMNFGDWFRSFVENYNHRYDSDPIHYRADDGTPQGWMFYVKPSLLGSAKYIDPEQTIAQNRISEKNVIVAKRVGIVPESEF